MSDEENSLSRRSILRRSGIVAGGLVVGTSAVTGQVAADEHECSGCLRVCWVDVKPNSCPNSVNAGSNGTLPVTAGYQNFDPTTVELIPVKADYDPGFGECQDWSNPDYDGHTAMELCELALESDRSASPTWYRLEDVDDDGDLDWKFKFDISDLELESDDTFLILRGESSTNDCTYFGIDSVRVLTGRNNGESEGNSSNGKGNGHGN